MRDGLAKGGVKWRDSIAKGGVKWRDGLAKGGVKWRDGLAKGGVKWRDGLAKGGVKWRDGLAKVHSQVSYLTEFLVEVMCFHIIFLDICLLLLLVLTQQYQSRHEISRDPIISGEESVEGESHLLHCCHTGTIPVAI